MKYKTSNYEMKKIFTLYQYLNNKTMKTQNEKSGNTLKIRIVLFFIGTLLFAPMVNAQENESVQTLFKSNVEFSEIWSPEVQVNSIQGNVGTLVGFYGGVLIDRTLLFGITGGTNLSQSKVNYGYFGGIAQYVVNPGNLVHFNAQIVLAYGSTKDYENPKKGLLDNFWNISGTNFYIVEPGINLEVNLRSNLSLWGGVSYRYVSGLNENSESVSRSHVTNDEMSGINFNIGIKICKNKRRTSDDSNR